MKILKKEKQENIVLLEIEVAQDQYDAAKENSLKDAAKKMKIPGFRPGKAPMHIVRQNIDEEVLKRYALEDLISSLYPQILKEAEIKPVDYPKVDIKDIEDGKPILFSLSIETYPEVKLGQYKGLDIKKESDVVSEHDILAHLTDLQNRMATHEEVSDRAIQSGDFIEGDLEAKINGNSVPGLSQKGIRLSVGDEIISAEFDQQMEGLKIGEEKTFSLDFPAGHKIAELAGQTVEFKIIAHKIKAKKLLPIDDDFAKKMGATEGLEKFKEEIRIDLEKNKKQEVEIQFKNKIVEAISKGSQVTAPKVFIEREAKIMLDEMRNSITQSGLTLEKYLAAVGKKEEDLLEEFKQPAEARVKSRLVLEAIGKEEKIEVTNMEVEEDLTLMAQEAGQDPADLLKNADEGLKEYLKDSILRRKALEFVVKELKK